MSDDPGAGPTMGPTTITIPAPAGATVSKASGDGWKCLIDGAKTTATCRALSKAAREVLLT